MVQMGAAEAIEWRACHPWKDEIETFAHLTELHFSFSDLCIAMCSVYSSFRLVGFYSCKEVS